MSAVMEIGTYEHFDLLPGNSGSEQPTLRLVSASNDDAPALVIGDVHGHLDRFEALLKQEGLLDHCPRCDGAGLIDHKILLSVENEIDCPVCEGDGWTRTSKPAQVIMLGDIGHFGQDGSPTGDLLTWLAAVRWADVILWGNHDRALVSEYHQFSGFLKPGPEVYHVIARARVEGRLKLAYAAHGYLMTHAGLAKAFRDQPIDPELKVDPYKFADWINEVEDPVAEGTKDQIAIRDAIGSRRGGWMPVGGILWRDINEKLYTGFPQVFGHSADGAEHQVRYVGPNFHTRKLKDYNTWALANKVETPMSYCVDVGGKGDKPGDNCLAGVWLPDGKVVRVDL